MNIPKILQESIDTLKNIVDNADDLVLLNALNSKMANLVSLKGCTFRQYSNSTPRTMSYYGMSFLHSGENKDYMVDCINDHLLSFVLPEMESIIENYKQQYEYEQKQLRHGKKAEKEIEEEIDRIRVVNLELANPNYTGLFREAEQIKNTGFGSLYIRIGEFGDYIENITSGDKSKKELYQKLKDIYEGTIYPSVVAGDAKRRTLKNIPVQVYIYTDFEDLQKEKNRELYITSLKTGFARRCFLYIPSNETKVLTHPRRFYEKEDAIFKAKELQKKFKAIYDSISEGCIYNLSEEAKERLYQYQCECIDYFNNSKDHIIVKIERKESFWKITKLAVVYSIIDRPLETVVSAKYVNMAIDFYKLMQPSLQRILDKRKKSEIELFVEYMVENHDKAITRTELRQANIINGNKFKKFFDDHFDEIKEELENTYGYAVYNYEGKGNYKAYQLVKVKE